MNRWADEQLRAAALAALADGIVIQRADGAVVEVNPAARRLLGLSATGAIARLDVALVGDDGVPLPVDETPWAQALRIGVGASGERLSLGDSGAPSLRITSSPISDDGALVGVTTVISERTTFDGATAGATSISERRFVAGARVAAAFAASPAGIAVVTADATIRDANPAFVQLVARRRDDVIGHQLTSMVLPEEAANLRARLHELSGGDEERAELELRLISGDGEQRWVLFHLARLATRRGAPPEVICQLLDTTDRRRFEEQLRHVADHDSLTGLLNRRTFEQVLAGHCADAERYGAEGALLVLDIDHFKVVNDALGHLAGDQLIVTVGHLLRERLRVTDAVARLGGDEFAALLPHASRDEAEAVATALLEAVRAQSVTFNDATSRPVTVSVGIALFEPGDGNATGMLAAADLAMYAAKEAGRDRFSFARPEAGAPEHAPSRISWVERIERALDEGRFTLLAQPVVSLRTGQVQQFELFVRMVDDAELVSPERFLYLAERVDLVARIDRWVLNQAIDLLVERAGEPFDVSVNVAGKSMASPLVLDLLTERLTGVPFDPRRLVFEVSEAAAMSSVANTQRFVDHVAGLGCRSALDDFGAGLGSLSYLKYLPFDFLKIDGAVVATCLSSAIDRTIVAAITTVATELGKLTIAEAVPDQATVDFLRRAGVDMAQGYFIGRPEPLRTAFLPGRPASMVAGG